MPRPIGLSEIVAAIGDDNIRLQSLASSITKATTKKNGDTTLTFLTNQVTASELMQGTPERTGLVIWLPTAQMNALLDAHHAASNSTT
jgi:hypothetical protein